MMKVILYRDDFDRGVFNVLLKQIGYIEDDADEIESVALDVNDSRVYKKL